MSEEVTIVSDAYSDQPADRLADPIAAAPAVHRRGSGVLMVLLLLVAGIGAAGAWFAFQYHQSLTALAERVTTTAGEVDAMAGLSARVAQAEQEAASLRAQLAASEAASQMLRQDMQQSLNNLRQQSAATDFDILIAEADYLIFAANQRLKLEQDLRSALAALQTADQRLASVEAPGLIDVRAQLASDINALQSVVVADVTGLSLALADAIERLPELPMRTISVDRSPVEVISARDFAGQDWRTVLRAIWADLRGLVEVRDATVTDAMVLGPDQQKFLAQNLRLELESARLAVLRRDSASLAGSARLALRAVDDYYDTASPAVAQLRAQLNGLLDIELQPALPDISRSLDAIRRFRMTAVSAPATLPAPADVPDAAVADPGDTLPEVESEPAIEAPAP